MNEPSESYRSTTNELGCRILALIPDHPEIMSIRDAFRLFDVPGFRCDDLQPSLAQADSALAWARAAWRRQHPAAP